MSSSYRSSRLGLSHWDPYAMQRRLPRVVLLKDQLVSFSECFDTVGLVIGL